MASLTAIIPNYNHGATVGRTIEAITSQSRPPNELILVDDGSTDSSVQVIESYAARIPYIRFLRNERNLGLFPSVKKALAAATGDYLYFGAADDEILPGFFQRAMSAVERTPHAGLFFGDYCSVSVTGHQLAAYRFKHWSERFLSPQEFMREALPRWVVTSFTPATIYRKDAFLEAGGYLDELASFTDTFSAWAVALKYGACYAPGQCCRFTINLGSMGNSDLRKPGAMQEIVRRTTARMRSPEFKDRFPAEFVDQWERDQMRLAQPVPLQIDAVRDAFIEVVRWPSPLLKPVALLMSVMTRSQKGPMIELRPDEPSVTKHPLDLARAYVQLATWKRPMHKFVSIPVRIMLSIYAMLGMKV